jgi:hypothetical protein
MKAPIRADGEGGDRDAYRPRSRERRQSRKLPIFKIHDICPHQQKEARVRVAACETQRSVARGYNVSQSTISRLTA